MKSVVETFNSILASIKDRVSNPFVGAFSVAWCLVNFRVVLTLFGDGSSSEKITYIECNLLNDNWRLWGWPLLAACIYLALFRPISALFVFLHEWTDNLYVSAKNVALRRKLISKEEREQIYAELHNKVKKAEEERAELAQLKVETFKKRDEISRRAHSDMYVVMRGLLPCYVSNYPGEKIVKDAAAFAGKFDPSFEDVLSSTGIPLKWIEFLKVADQIFPPTEAQYFLGNESEAMCVLLALEVMGCIAFSWTNDGARYTIKEPAVLITLLD